MPRFLRLRCLPLCALALTACAPEPHYDDTLGITGVSVPAGTLAGTFALKIELITQTELPLIGTATGGGATYVLVDRTYDAGSGSYGQTHQLCGGRIRGEYSTSSIPTENWQKVPATAPRDVELRDADGFAQVGGHLELWGLEGLEDPYEGAIPLDAEEAASEPHASHVVDMDEDGNPGFTVTVEGLASGDFYFVQRKITDMEGVVLGPDRVVGLHVTDFHQTIIGAANGPVQQGYSTVQHPDPKESWYEEVRITDGGDCDDVLQAVEDETLSPRRPF